MSTLQKSSPEHVDCFNICHNRLELQWFDLHFLIFYKSISEFLLSIKGKVDSYSSLIESKTSNLRSRKLQLVSE